MEDVELVIKIPNAMYEDIKFGKDGYSNYVHTAIRNGTPLDLEGLKSDMKALNCGFPYGLDYLLDCLDKRLGVTINS